MDKILLNGQIVYPKEQKQIPQEKIIYPGETIFIRRGKKISGEVNFDPFSKNK
jgi:hypothetical protein